MSQTSVNDAVKDAIARAEALDASGRIREAIDLLTQANREARDGALEQALVRLRRDGTRWLKLEPGQIDRERVLADGPGGEVYEIPASELSLAALRTGLARSGCLLVRGLVPPDRVGKLIGGIDAALAAYDAAEAGRDSEVDPAWYSPRDIQDRGLPGDKVTRRFVRPTGGLWTILSPHMLFELFELVDDVGIGALMTAFLGETPVFSANKGTLRRVEPTAGLGGWHQDGAFLGDAVGSLNFWLALTRCGIDAPGMDLVPRRIEHVLTSGEGADFVWSLSHEAALAAAGPAGIARPVFEAGDALLFDHLLIHRTAATAEMTAQRYAIESWFFGPSAYPEGQTPAIY